MSPRLTSRITGRSCSWAQRMTAPSACQPAAPYCSKNAACGLTQAATSATASMTPLQNSWKQAATAASSPISAACGRYFSTSSGGMRSSAGSKPTHTTLRRARMAVASLSEKCCTRSPLCRARAMLPHRARARSAATADSHPSGGVVRPRSAAAAWNCRTLRRMVAILARTKSVASSPSGPSSPDGLRLRLHLAEHAHQLVVAHGRERVRCPTSSPCWRPRARRPAWSGRRG